MSLENTVSAERIHISFFGKRNAGKSSLVNAVTGQNMSVVSDVCGTTTDPVKKSMELLPLGPVVIIDTPGFDDEGELGELRVQKTREIITKTDIAVLVVDSQKGIDKEEEEFLARIKEKNMPFAVVYTKADLVSEIPDAKENTIWVSAEKNININEFKQMLGKVSQVCHNTKRVVGDLIRKGDIVVLVTPVDESAPKGRLILPQQQTIRDILDSEATAIVCQVEQLADTLCLLSKPPKMVITDSQAFGKVSKLVPTEISLTSFSILFARYKGNLAMQVKGASMLGKLEDGDRILISEGCTHHRQCGDIGTVKLPAWIKGFSGADIDIDFTSGGQFPDNVSGYKLIVHCGACMLNEAEMKHRLSLAENTGVPVTNYGVAIAHINGILKRSLELFPEVMRLL